MPTRKARKRKHDEMQPDSENDEEMETASQSTKRRRLSNKSPTKRNAKSKTRNKAKAKPKSTPKRKARAKSKKSHQTEMSDHSDEEKERESASPEDEEDSSEFEPSQSNLAHRKRISPSKSRGKPSRKKTAHKSPRRRMSVSQSQTSQRSHSQRAQSQSHPEEEDGDDDETEFKLVAHNERVMEMYSWLTSNTSWTESKKALQRWMEEEKDVEDSENYDQLGLDIVNLILYCGGVRVMKLDDIGDLDIEAWTAREKKQFVKQLEAALQVHHEDIESLPVGADKDDEEEEEGENEDDEAQHSEDEKAEEENGANNAANKNKKAKKSKSKKKGNSKKTDKSPRSNAEKVLDFDPLLWRNGKKAEQDRFVSRYRQLMLYIAQTFETQIYENDDWIIGVILKWCTFLARSFQITQFRRLGTFTAFCLCTPLVQCTAKQRKPMEKLQDQLERKRLALEHQQEKRAKSKRGSPRKQKRNKKTGNIEDDEELKGLKLNIEEYQGKINNIEAHTNDIFKKIAVYKASDSSEIIRCMVLEHIVKWINMDPSTQSFLNQQHYQYLLYGLQDKHSSKVRATALECLMDLFDFQRKFHGQGRHKKPSASKSKKRGRRGDDGDVIEEGEENKLDETRKQILEPFWERIDKTINALLKDKDENVVKKAIEFVNILLRGDMLGPDDGDCILNYIFDESDDIRQVAAKFIYHDTFDDQAVLKSYDAKAAHHEDDDDEDEKKDDEMDEDTQRRIRINHQKKMRDDVHEIVQLMKDRVVDLNMKVNSLLECERAKLQRQRDQAVADEMEVDEEEEEDAVKHKKEPKLLLKENALYRNYVQVADYIVQSMCHQLDVLSEWNVLFTVLEEADKLDQRQKEANITDKATETHEVAEMEVNQDIDDEGQTILCYLILSCIKRVVGKLDEQVRNVKEPRGRKEKQKMDESKQKALDQLKECVLPYLSRLLEIYQADVFKLYPLIKIIPLIPIDAFNGVKQKEYLNGIINSLKIIFSRHETPFVSMRGMNDDTESDADEDEPDARAMSEDLSEEEQMERQSKLRDKHLCNVKKCIKREIDNELIEVVGKAFSFLCNEEYQYRDHSGRIIFDVVRNMLDEFEKLFDQIDQKLEKGHNFQTLDGLMDDEDDVSKLHLVQSMYSNLHKQYALKCNMDVATIQWTRNMNMLLSNVYEDFLFDGTNFQLSGVLHKILSTEIARTVTNKINFKSPDLERLQDIRDQKQSLVKLLEYYVEKISKHIEQNQKLLTWTQTLAVLDKVVSILDVLTFFVRIKDQSSLLDEVFNNASMKDIEATRMNNDSISVLKQRLLAICEFVLDLPAVEDPFDPSAHTTSENLQLRFLFGAARLCLMNPTYYKQFGAWIICIWHGSKAESKEAPMSVRRTEVIRNIMGKLLKEHHDKFEEILFESTKMIMNNEKISTELRTHHLDKLCQSVFMLKGFKKDRKYWIKFTKLFLNYTVGVAENIPNYFSYLHALTYLFRHLTNRDKLDIWKHFRSLSRKLPDQELRTDESKWALYQQFRSKLKAEAQRASQHRQLELDDDAIENLDLTQSQTQIHSQSQMVPLSQHDINIGVHIEDDDDHVVPERNRDADVGVDDNKQNGADEEKKEDDAGEEDEVSAPLRRLSISKESPAKKKKKTNERVSVGVSRSRRDDDDADGDEEEEEVEQESEIESEADNHNRRVSVSKPSRNRRKNGNHDEEEEEEEEEVDIPDGEDEHVDEKENRSSKGTRKRGTKSRGKQTRTAKSGQWVTKKA